VKVTDHVTKKIITRTFRSRSGEKGIETGVALPRLGGFLQLRGIAQDFDRLVEDGVDARPSSSGFARR
jgi:hypothetical protein